MSAPYIIPFNFQPVSTVASASGTYTVPSGKYAKVIISNAILPVLNSNNLYSTKSYFGANPGGTTATLAIQCNNAHRINLTQTVSGIIYFNLGSVTPSASNYNFLQSNAGGQTFLFATPTNTTVLSAFHATAIGLSALSVDSCSIQEIWLKAGDVLTYSAGSILYTEYNVIS